MRRRSLLVALAAGLAGCGGTGGDRRGTFGVPATDEPTGGGATTGGGTTGSLPPGIEPRRDRPRLREARRAVTTLLGKERRLVVAGGSLPPYKQGGRLTVGFVRPPTPDRPARIRTVFTNASGERRRFAFGPSPPFSGYWATPAGGPPDARSYLLVPDDDRRFPYGDIVPESPTDGRWVATDPLGTPTGPVERTAITLDPGESVAGTYALLVHPGSDRRDREVYRFAGAPWTRAELLLSDYRTLLSDPGTSRFGLGRQEPDLPGSTDTRWYHEIARRPDAPEVFLRPARELLPIDGDGVAVGVENYEPYAVSVGGWHLYRRDSDAWRRIAPWGRGDGGDAPRWPGRDPLYPGQRREFVFAPASRVRSGREAAVPGIRVGGLGPGRYALAFGPARVGGPAASSPAVVGDPSASPPGELRVTLGALMDLTGPTATVTPTEGVADVDREGTAVTVRVEPRFLPDPVEGPELVVRRTEAGTPGRTLLAEQVNQFPALRNALVHFEAGVERVRVVTRESRVARPLSALGSPDSPLSFAFRGAAYEASARDVVGGSPSTTTGG